MNGILYFYIYKRIYGIKIESVIELVEEQSITELFRTPSSLPGVTNLRGKILAVINIAELFNIRSSIKRAEKRKFIIISEPAGKEAALIVDDILEVKWLDEFSFQEIPDTIDENEKKYLLYLIKTDGSPIPVIDSVKLLNDDIWKNISIKF